ncbi:MAG: discoidin domain-containing protein, partial [Acidobacteria bacterium]|nr:discoidin domain-containing protein [Acidobacteriota bacterium]
RDPALYSEAAPRPLYGRDVAVGTRSWFEAAGKVYHNDALTDGKLWTDFGTPYDNKEKWAESFAYVDLGRTVRVVHMEWIGGDANWMRKVDVAASADGKAYTPVEGLQGLDFYHKWGPQEIDVPQPFEARFIRLRCHIGDGERIPAFRFPAEFRVYAGVAEEAWAFPKAGPVLFQGKRTETVPARGFSAVEIGDGRALSPGAYLAAVRTKGGGVTQMNYGHIFVMPPAMDRITRDSRFGMNGVGLVELAKRQGNGWNRFENLKWPFVSPAPGVYKFDGSVNPYVKFDELFRTYHERGLFTMPYLFLTARYMVPEGAKGDGMTTPPKDLSKYGEFVFQAVARYGSKKHPAGELLTEDKVSGLGYLDTFELWNEADLNDPNWGSWRGVFTDYYVMYRFGAEAVKKADPDATVANGGWSGMDVPLMETMRNYKYPDGKCPLDFTDLLSVHYYSFRVAPELATINDNTVRDGVPPQDQQTFEHSLAALVAWRDTHKPSMPIWISETGYDSGGPRGVDERLQACWLPRDVMMILASGIDKVQVFREKGSGGGLFESSGVIRDDESLKPSWFTYATLIRQLDGVTQRPAKVPFEDGNIRMYLWKRGDKAIVTVWAIAGAARLDVALGRCTVTDAFGASRTMDAPQPLELTEFPLYLTDFADPAVVKHLQEQARTMAEKERRRIERLSKAQTYLFDFGSMDRVGTRTLAPGVVRPFTPVVAADRYGESEDYGFETKVVADKVEAWRRNPLTEDEVILEGAARFTFNARPGDYVLQIYARPDKDNQVFIRGIEGGDVALKVPSGGEIVTATVKVGAKPVTLETGTGFYGALCWISMVPVDRPEP